MFHMLRLTVFADDYDVVAYTQEIGGVRGCAYCGGLGHRIGQCPKLESQKRQTQGSTGKDYLTSGSRYGGTGKYGGEW